jgi:predicted NBD/HSP70 family sugar kinase
LLLACFAGRAVPPGMPGMRPVGLGALANRGGVAVVSDLRRQNRGLILGDLLANGPMTRVEIAHATALSSATVTRVVAALMEDGLASEVRTLSSAGRGRRAVLLDVSAEDPVAIGVDLGVVNTRIAIVALTGRLIGEVGLATPAGATALELAVWIGQSVRDAAGEAWASVRSIGVGLPGVVHPITTHVSLSPGLRQIEGAEFIDSVRTALDRTVLFDNEANFALLGEMYSGAALGNANAVMFTIGAGLGAGVAIEGRIFRGSTGIVGEYGSLAIAGDGAPLEDLLTTSGILRMARSRGVSIDGVASLFLPSSDPAILAVRSQFEDALVTAITASVVSVDPAVVVLGGSIAPALVGMTERLGQRVSEVVGVRPTIRLAEQGDLAGALGAAAQALHHVLTNMDVPDRYLARIPRPPGA